MKVFLDTNILISAALFPNSVPFRAFAKAATSPNDAIISDVVVDEMRRTFNRKFPDRIAALDTFLAMASSVITITDTPEEACPEEAKIRDENDRPVFRAAVAINADIFLTGDKDFLEADIWQPKIMSPSDFLEME